jgi:hypothetical protein
MKEPFDGQEKKQILAELWAEARKPEPTEAERKLEKWQAFAFLFGLILLVQVCRYFGWI